MSNRTRTSEYVTLGHPDKVADYISEYVLDKLIAMDPATRYAVECQIKDNYVNLVGEVKTKAQGWEKNLTSWVREAVNDVGYTSSYQKKFGGPKYTICGKDIEVTQHISEQSPDISVGVDQKGWGDQGIFFGTWNNETEEGFTKEYSLARKIGNNLYKKALKDEYPYGIDIKTQVTYDVVEKKVTHVIVAIPTVEGALTSKQIQKQVSDRIKKEFPETKEAKFTINGTGEYHIHGPVGDSGTTGRKLVVDFYGAGSKIGGGSPWTKDGTKADLSLNIMARELAYVAYNQFKPEMPSLQRVDTELSCCIGKPNVLCCVTAYDEEGIPIHRFYEDRKIETDILIKRYDLNQPNFKKLCREGLFSNCLKGA